VEPIEWAVGANFEETKRLYGLYIANVMERYPQVGTWDVANELIDDETFIRRAMADKRRLEGRGVLETLRQAIEIDPRRADAHLRALLHPNHGGRIRARSRVVGHRRSSRSFTACHDIDPP
jgi:hypothetical protein